jgi:hypothetical protein
MKKWIILLIALAGTGISLMGQEKNKDASWGIRFNGFVKNDIFYDTRQTVAAREGHFLLWPAPESPDANQQDINANSSFNMLAVQSRLSGRISGPEALGAKTTGKIEGDFFAQANDNINLFRLRHAFVQLSWENTQLLMGQYWNPMFITSCFPGTVSFNTGVPIQPFARNPQIRLTQKLGDFSLIAAALAQRDYTSRAYNRGSSEFLRNSGIPDMHLHLHYDHSSLNAGAGLAYKTIVPRLATEENLKTDAKISGLSAVAFTKLTLKPVTVKLEVLSGQNLTDLLQISGFAVEKIQQSTDFRSYLPLRNISVWGDIHTNGNNLQAGLFAGYTKNRGTQNTILNEDQYIYGFGNNILSLYRISPRILYNSGKVRLALEGEYTSATFGKDYNEYAVPINTNTKGNLRILFSSYYFF